VRPVAAAAEVRENERDARMPLGKPREIAPVGDFLVRPLAGAMLPDVVQDRKTVHRGRLANRIEQRVIGSATREQLHTDCPALDAALDLRQRVIGVIRVHCHIPPDARIFGELRHRIVSD